MRLVVVLTFLCGLFRYMVEEISPIFAEFHAAFDHLRDVLKVLFACFNQFSGCQVIHQAHQPIISERNSDRPEFEVAEEIVNPGMGPSPIETIERLSKGQVADHVKGCPVEPAEDVQGALSLAGCCQTVHELVSIPSDPWLLFTESLSGESV